MSSFIAWKVYKYGVFSGPNTGKYRPEKTLYLETFHAVLATSVQNCFEDFAHAHVQI